MYEICAVQEHVGWTWLPRSGRSIFSHGKVLGVSTAPFAVYPSRQPRYAAETLPQAVNLVDVHTMPLRKRVA